MPITQRFYPKFFKYALLGAQNTTFSRPYNNAVHQTLDCKIALYDTQISFDENDYSQSGIVKGLVSGTPQDCTVTMLQSRFNGPNTLEFIFSPKTWTGPLDEPFRYAVVYTLPISGTDDISDEFGGGLLFMHFDFGEVLNPTGNFTLSLDFDSCVPRIDFTPVACTVGGGGGGFFDVMA